MHNYIGIVSVLLNHTVQKGRVLLVCVVLNDCFRSYMALVKSRWEWGGFCKGVPTNRTDVATFGNPEALQLYIPRLTHSPNLPYSKGVGEVW